jgi:hypothetical protein
MVRRQELGPVRCAISLDTTAAELALVLMPVQQAILLRAPLRYQSARWLKQPENLEYPLMSHRRKIAVIGLG